MKSKKKKRKYPAVEARKKKQKEQFLEVLERTGNIGITCNKLDIARRNIYRWKEEDTQFARNVKEAILQGTVTMNDIVESALFDQVREKKFQAIKYYLANKHPGYGGSVVPRIIDDEMEDEPLSLEEEKHIDEVLQAMTDAFGVESARG